MNKKILTIAALFAAGTAFANAVSLADTATITSTDGTGTGYGTYYGICFTLNGTTRLSCDEELTPARPRVPAKKRWFAASHGGSGVLAAFA